jgi:hypothetical protein
MLKSHHYGGLGRDLRNENIVVLMMLAIDLLT